ncbi:hypothetical protein [Streptococcus iniae]
MFLVFTLIMDILIIVGG